MFEADTLKQPYKRKWAQYSSGTISRCQAYIVIQYENPLMHVARYANVNCVLFFCVLRVYRLKSAENQPPDT